MGRLGPSLRSLHSIPVKDVWQILWLTIRKSCVLAFDQFLHKRRSKTTREKDSRSKIRASMSNILVVVRFPTNYLPTSSRKIVDGIRTDRTVPAETSEMNQQFRDARLWGVSCSATLEEPLMVSDGPKIGLTCM